MSCGKSCKWHFQDPKFKLIFLVEHAPRPPLDWAAFGATTFLSRARTPSRYHATPLIHIINGRYTTLFQSEDDFGTACHPDDYISMTNIFTE